MNKREREDWGRFVLALDRRAKMDLSHRAAMDGATLRGIGRSLSRIAERACSEPMTEEQEARADKREARLLDQAREIAAAWPNRATVYHQGDIPEGEDVGAWYSSRGLAVPQ